MRCIRSRSFCPADLICERNNYRKSAQNNSENRKGKCFLLIFLKAFFVGGLICVIGQILIDVTKMTPARILVTFVVLGVILGATGVYDKLVDFAGAGATVPLTGFGNVLVNGTKEAIREKGLLGVLTGPLCAGSQELRRRCCRDLWFRFLQNRKANKKHPFKD